MLRILRFLFVYCTFCILEKPQHQSEEHVDPISCTDVEQEQLIDTNNNVDKNLQSPPLSVDLNSEGDDKSVKLQSPAITAAEASGRSSVVSNAGVLEPNLNDANADVDGNSGFETLSNENDLKAPRSETPQSTDSTKSQSKRSESAQQDNQTVSGDNTDASAGSVIEKGSTVVEGEASSADDISEIADETEQ